MSPPPVTPAVKLPNLRDELDLLPGPTLTDGQPSWTLHDPVRHQFYRLDWLSFELLSRWPLGDSQSILDSVAGETTLQPEMGDLEILVRFLINNQLVQLSGQGQAAKLALRLAAAEGTWLKWLLHHYLFFRVPLFKPDSWLTRMLPLVERFYTSSFAVITALALSLGIWQVIRHSDEFFTTLVDTLSFEGLTAYGLALIAAKLMHELGHAFTARRLGCRVPTIGVAFLVLWPMAYTDTTETWRLTSRWSRLQVAAAGIATELVIAAWALLAWALLPDGSLRAAAFFLATASIVTTLLVNASPFMRFDGYFILCDWLDMPNLHARSFALARWRLREWLFALQEPKPENFPLRKERALIIFAFVVWLYRLMVFLGIAVMVYQFFIKSIGLILFAVEIVWFVFLPVANELKAWAARWPAIRASRTSSSRAFLSLLITLLLGGLAFAPLPSRVTASALLRPAQVWTAYAPSGAQMVLIPRRDGDHVVEGDELFQLYAPELKMRRWALAARAESLRWQAEATGVDPDARNRMQSTREALGTVLAELASLETEASLYSPRAPFAGVLRDLDPDLRPGQWITRRERIATLIGDDGRWIVETWLDEEAVQRIREGDRAHFSLDGGAGPTVRLQVQRIEVDATRVLPRHELATNHGGHILTRSKGEQLVPERAIYRVILEPLQVESAKDNSAFNSDGGPFLEHLSGHTWRGRLSIETLWQAPLLPYFRQATAVLIRELGF